MESNSITWQFLLGFGITQLGALYAAYYGLKADNAKLDYNFQIAMRDERADRLRLIASEKHEMMTICGKLETYVNDLTHRVSTLEAGQDEWTKALRQRTHELANDLHSLVLKVDRLERPQHHS